MSSQLISALEFTNESVRGGAEEHLLTLLQQFDRERFRLFLVCTPECLEKLRPDVPADVTVLPLALRSPSDIGAAFRFAQILRRNKIGIVHSHMFHASLVASPIAWLCGVPVIIETPHVREAWRHGWFKGSYAVDRLVGRFVDRYIAVSEANGRYLATEKRIQARKIQVICNGCDLRRFDPAGAVPPDLKRSLGFDESDPVALVLGRLEPQKGHSVLLEAFRTVVREIPAARLVCAGDGRLLTELLQQTEKLGLAKSVRFVGFQSDTPKWLAMATMTVLPSFFEGLPLVAIESLAAGRPMVATAVDGTAEVVVDEKTGLTVPAGEAKPLAAAIIRILKDPAFAAKLAAAGRQWVLDKFNQDRQVRATEELYLDAWRRARKERPTNTDAVKHRAASSAEPGTSERA